MNYYLMTKSENELYHHGVKGQRWGFRRYQRKDGTLTNAGRKRYNKELEKAKNEQKRLKQAEKDQKSLAKLKKIQDDNSARKNALNGSSDKASTKTKKSVKDMSTEELQEKINRLQLERHYKQLLNDPVMQPNKNNKSAVSEILQSAGRKAVDNIATQTFNYVLGQTINKIAGKNSLEYDRVVNPYKGQKDKS